MAGIMLGAGLYPMLLAAQDPRGRMLPDLRGIGAERARLDDGIAGLEVEIAHRRERPGDPDSAGLRGGDDAAGAGGCDVREEAEGRGRRELGQTFDLLAGPALQVSADEQPPARLLAEVVRQRADGLHRADRKSTRLNSSHGYISYAVFCLKKKKQNDDKYKLDTNVN